MVEGENLGSLKGLEYPRNQRSEGERGNSFNMSATGFLSRLQRLRLSTEGGVEIA